jgi:type VI secretion system secreted protein Hcp
MAFDCFLKVSGIPGESTDDKHSDWIEVLDFGWRVSQPASGSASSGGGASAERADFGDFTISKTLDKASPKLMLACADGTHIDEITLELCRAGGDKLKYMEYKLTDAMVTSVEPGGMAQADTLPVERISFNFGKIELTYTHQDRAGGRGKGNVAAGWDLRKNKKV